MWISNLNKYGFQSVPHRYNILWTPLFSIINALVFPNTTILRYENRSVLHLKTLELLRRHDNTAFSNMSKHKFGFLKTSDLIQSFTFWIFKNHFSHKLLKNQKLLTVRIKLCFHAVLNTLRNKQSISRLSNKQFLVFKDTSKKVHLLTFAAEKL